LEVIDVPSK